MKKMYGITAETIYKNDGRNTVVRPSDVWCRGMFYLAVKVEFMNK